MSQLPVNTVKPDLSFVENETINRLLNFDRELLLDSKLDEVDNFMKNNSGQGLSDLDKDDLYAKVQLILNEFKMTLRDVKFNFYLNRPQYNLLTDLLLKKLEYDVNTIFIAIELTNLLGTMSKTKYTNDKDVICFEANATEITYIYHLIQTYKVKGLSKDAYTFSKILIRMGDLSKVINYYDTCAKNSVDDIQKWALKMDDGVVVGETVESTPVEKPKKAKKKDESNVNAE